MHAFRHSLLCLALGGCTAVGPAFEPVTPAAPGDWSSWHGGNAALLAPALQAAAIPGAGVAFSDPVLRMLLDQALAASPDLQTATLHFAQSRVQAGIAGAGRGPQAGVNSGLNRQRQSENGAATRLIDAIAPANSGQLKDVLAEPFSLSQAGFDASWELDLWGRVRRQIEAADAGSEAAGALLRQARVSIASEVARNYFDMRGAQGEARLLKDEIAAVAEMLELARARADGGIGNDVDVVRQRTALAELRSRAPALDEREAQAINRITLLTGRHPGALQEQLAARDAPLPALPDLALGMPSELASRRPDIVAAQARLHAATAGIGVAEADLYPRITIGARLGVESVGAVKFGDWGSRAWSLGPSLSLPLFDQGRRRATVELRTLEQQEAAIAYQQTVLRAWHEVDSALSSYGAAWQRQQEVDQKVRGARSALALAHSRYARGIADMLPELEARRTLLQAQREQVQGATGISVTMISIIKATGATP